MSNESPIFRKSYEMLVWLLAHTRKFPKDQRFVMAKRMEEAALDFHDSLLRAARGKRPQTSLETADFHLARLVGNPNPDGRARVACFVDAGGASRALSPQLHSKQRPDLLGGKHPLPKVIHRPVHHEHAR